MRTLQDWVNSQLDSNAPALAYRQPFGPRFLPFQGQALAAYKPSLTFVKLVYHLDIQANGSATQVFESAIRIETANAVRKFGERRISFSGSHETLDVLEAYTLQPDGTKVPLEPDQIRTQWFGCRRL